MAATEERPAEPAAPKRRGRPPKATSGADDGTASATTVERSPRATKAATGKARRAKGTATGKRVPLHVEIMAVIGERGPMTAADLASAITERGIFQPPRSGKALDAATVNSRVSNPVYRARFRRDGHRITLAG